jgi:hypothetical protein
MASGFGERAVSSSNKCTTIREKATTLPADVIPCRTHRRYDSRLTYNDGIEIHPDKGSVIVNWPKQDDDNGTEKNKRTNLLFERAVRGIKSLENEMVDTNFIEPVPSFMMECAIGGIESWRFPTSRLALQRARTTENGRCCQLPRMVKLVAWARTGASLAESSYAGRGSLPAAGR